MAAVPRVDKKVYFRGAVLALNGGEEPPLREAAKTLVAMPGKNVGKKIRENSTRKLIKIVEKKLEKCYFCSR
jgi:hypothetical protein